MKFNITSIITCCALLALLFSACKESVRDTFSIDYGYGYYPLGVNKYWIYQIDSTLYEIDGSGNEVNYESRRYIRDEIKEIIVDNEGDTAYFVERYEKLELSDPDWVIKGVYSSKLSGDFAETSNGNIRLIQMIFPLRAGDMFDASRYVDPDLTVVVAGESIEPFRNWDSETLSVGQPETVGGRSYDEVATIRYADEENLIEKRYAVGKYAKGIGLIYQEEWILDDQSRTEEAWEDKADKGYILVKTLLENG